MGGQAIRAATSVPLIRPCSYSVGRPVDAARYRHTHWVGSFRTPGKDMIFDVNCMCVGGWVPLSEWSELVVPWLLKQCVPKANGKWHITHVVEIAKTQEGLR